MIRARIEAIKGGGEVKKKGIRKILWGERNRMRETGVLRVSPRNSIVSKINTCNCNHARNGNRNSLLVFPIMPCLFLMDSFSCVNYCCRDPR